MAKNPDLQKVTLNLRAGDWEYLENLFASKGYPTSVVVRNVISTYVDNMRKREEPASLPAIEMDFPDE